MAPKKPKAPKAAAAPAPQPEAPVTLPPGRPTTYRPEHCQALIEHMRLGYSFESFAGRIGVARSTLYEWEKAQPDFSDAKKVGVDASLFFWEGLGTRAAAGSLMAKNFNATAWVFSMKNRFGWKDRTEVAGDPDNPVKSEIKLTIRDFTADDDGHRKS